MIRRAVIEWTVYRIGCFLRIAAMQESIHAVHHIASLTDMAAPHLTNTFCTIVKQNTLAAAYYFSCFVTCTIYRDRLRIPVVKATLYAIWIGKIERCLNVIQ